MMPVETIAEMAGPASLGSGTDRLVEVALEESACPACVAEIFDRASRRFRYAFTRCPLCGPARSGAAGPLAARKGTARASRSRCAACLREIAHEGGRRYGFGLTACPVCGPRLQVVLPDGSGLSAPDPIRTAAAWIAARQIVAIEEAGGFLFACDATAADVVTELRLRLDAGGRPSMVMASPIVEAQAHRLATGSAGARLVAPRTPLHHLLLADAARPLLMTPASSRPGAAAARTRAEELSRLAPVADVFLVQCAARSVC